MTMSEGSKRLSRDELNLRVAEIYLAVLSEHRANPNDAAPLKALRNKGARDRAIAAATQARLELEKT